MKLIIQIPCFNEEKTLPVTIKDLPTKIEGIDIIEYLVIDDGSKDKTVEVARKCGVHHIVKQKRNRGLAKAFIAGVNASVLLGADIIVNTDADNQYCGADIEKLVTPILEGKADMVIGERPISDIDHFSPLKKKLQRFGSFVVRISSNTHIPDAPSGFRAYSREVAMRINVVSEYTYTLETIIQAGHSKFAIDTVPIRTNPELRKSRLFKSMFGYIKRSMSTIIRSLMMYKPLKFFTTLGLVILFLGSLPGFRYLYFLLSGHSTGHIQSLILCSILIVTGFLTVIFGLISDITAANRKILEDIQYRVKKLEYEQNKCNDYMSK